MTLRRETKSCLQSDHFLFYNRLPVKEHQGVSLWLEKIDFAKILKTQD